MSFTTALGNVLGGFAQGRAQAQDFSERKRMDDAALSAEQLQEQQVASDRKQADEDRMRARGIDPATGQPIALPGSLTQIRPNNKGKGGPVTPQEQMNHFYALANFYAQQGDLNQANVYMSQAGDIAAQIKAEQTAQAQWMRDVFNQREQDNRALLTQNGQDDREDKRLKELLAVRDLPSAYERWEMEHPPADRTGAVRQPKVTPEQAADAKAQWYGKWQQATKSGTTTNGVPTPPLVPVAAQAAAGKLFSAVDGAQDPVAKANELSAHVQNPSIKSLLSLRARYVMMERTSKQEFSSGGSQDAPPFPGQ